jgi:sterol desaturase/sphingolipid hydroxylase (fatty acid hydroxylase superfamily)
MSLKRERKMYQNPVLELLSQSGPKMMITFHLFVIGCQLWIGNTQNNFEGITTTHLSVFVLGIITWTIAEYFLHRYLFHIEGESKWLKAFHYAMHGYHHSTPNDSDRLFMPPIPALLFLAVFFGIFYSFLGNLTWFFLPGFELGYLVYSFIHYSVHTRRAPKGFEKLWHHHLLHHYKEPEKAFGVSSRIWDRIFKTLP